MTTTSVSVAIVMGLIAVAAIMLLRQRPGSSDSAAHTRPESDFAVNVSNSEVVCRRPDGRIEHVAWDDLQAIVIETTDAGPIAPDVFWILVGNSPTSSCVVPQGAKGDTELLKRLQDLPGFDNEAFIQAMSSTENGKFVCWKRP